MLSTMNKFMHVLCIGLFAAVCLSLVARQVHAQSFVEDATNLSEPDDRANRLADLSHLIGAAGMTDAIGSSSNLEKMDSHLQALLIAHLGGTDAMQVAQATDIEITADQAVLMDVYVNGPLDQTILQLESLGMRVTGSTDLLGGIVEGYLPMNTLSAAVNLASTQAFIPVMGSGVDVGAVTSQGDASHNGPAARATGTTGAGVVVGVISDSIDQLGSGVAGSQATSDLPANVTILTGGLPGDSDEGRAMAEIVYDTAPGVTDMYFSTGTATGAIGKRDSINALVASGVDIIADDIYYLGEPFFQDGVISQAVDAAKAAGVAYFASAGNRSRQSYESDFRASGGNFHDFDPDVVGVDNVQNLTPIANLAGVTVVLQWGEPWGSAATDFDLFLYNVTDLSVLASSTTNNVTTGLPYESLFWTNSSVLDATVGVVIRRICPQEGCPQEDSPPFLKTIVHRADFAEWNTNSDTINPDAAAAQGSMAVAAIDWAEAGLNDPESYSSRGPKTRLFDKDGVALASPEIRQKPQIAGADCVATSFGFGGGSFCGTSAATPSVAGVAALLLSYRPQLTVDQLFTALTDPSSTIDCTLAGQPDTDCGYGFVLADKALDAAKTLPLTFVVNTTADGNDGKCEPAPGNCSLREAIQAANETAIEDTITFSVTGTITLAGSLPDITNDVKIAGTGQSIVIDGAGSYRVMKVDANKTLKLYDLTIQNGFTNSPTLAYGLSGGGIYNDGVLDVRRVTFKGNHAENYGGAVFNTFVAKINNSTFSGNSATDIGGGIDSTGLNAVLEVNNSTFSDNTAPSGAGLQSDTTLLLRNTIIANSNGPDCTRFGTIGVGGDQHNLIEGTGASACGLVNGVNGDVIGVNPRLGALADNGGDTRTLALLSGSPAINAASTGQCLGITGVNGLDQTGRTRMPDGGAACDIGAYEVWDTESPNAALDSFPPIFSGSTTASFSFSGTDNFTLPADLKFKCYSVKDNVASSESDCASPLGLVNLVEGTYDFFVYAVDDVGNDDDRFTPAAYTWDVDLTAPNVSIDTKPTDPSDSTSASFSFSSSEGAVTFSCDLDGGGYSLCTSPNEYTDLSEGSHAFSVRATDSAGNTGTPATHTWTVDTPPDISIDTKPADSSNDASAEFNFSSSDGTATFSCELDGNGFSACTSPTNYTDLSDGSHTFSVKAIDPGGKTGTPATYTWMVETTEVDTAPPVVSSILRADPNPAETASVDFTVNLSEPVTGVNSGDFTLTTTGVLGAAVTGMNGTGSVYVVSVSTGAGNGTIRLDLKSGGTGIQDLAGNPINGGFTSGAVYDVVRAYDVYLPTILR